MPPAELRSVRRLRGKLVRMRPPAFTVPNRLPGASAFGAERRKPDTIHTMRARFAAMHKSPSGLLPPKAATAPVRAVEVACRRQATSRRGNSFAPSILIEGVPKRCESTVWGSLGERYYPLALLLPRRCRGTVRVSELLRPDLADRRAPRLQSPAAHFAVTLCLQSIFAVFTAPSSASRGRDTLDGDSGDHSER